MKKKVFKNIVFITIDCLRADHLHCMGYPKEISPTIDALAKNGVKFTNAFSNAPYTPYSVPSFITSRIPPIGKNVKETIASILKKNGYATAAFAPNPMVFGFDITQGESITRGFDTFDMMLSCKQKYRLFMGSMRQYGMNYFRRLLKEEGWMYKFAYPMYDKIIYDFPEFFSPKENFIIPSAEDINKCAIKWIENQRSKFFLWIHYMDVHEPYSSPFYDNQKEMLYLITKYRDFPNKLTKHEIHKLIDLYDLTIKYVDGAIHDLFEKLKELNLFENSIIIITADHGDAFGEHCGILGHGGKFKVRLYDEVIHVPLIFFGIEKKGMQINKVVQLLDLGPTICELVDIPTPASFFGENLFSKSHKGAIINSWSYIANRTDKYKIVINKSDPDKSELYDLINDPLEEVDISDKNRHLVHNLKQEMISVLSDYSKKRKMLDIISINRKNFSKFSAPIDAEYHSGYSDFQDETSSMVALKPSSDQYSKILDPSRDKV